MFQRVLIAGALILVLIVIVVALSANKDAIKSSEHPIVLMETSMGDVKVELYPEKTPETVRNFMQYVNDKYYDGTVFHRVISDFMIQGGGYEVGKPITPGDEKKTREPIKNEASKGLANERGTIAMARTGEPHSATSQFFINVADNTSKLDPGKRGDPFGYCAFGKVIEGMDVVDKIKLVPTDQANGDKPLQDVIIKTIRRVDK